MSFVYHHLNDKNECIYVGVTDNIHRRTIAHRSAASWKKEISNVISFDCENRMEAASLEVDHIRNLKPKHNSRHTYLPTDTELEGIQLALRDNSFYDHAMRFFRIQSDDQLKKFFFCSAGRIKMIRMGLIVPSWEEEKHVMDMLFCSNLQEAKRIIMSSAKVKNGHFSL